MKVLACHMNLTLVLNTDSAGIDKRVIKYDCRITDEAMQHFKQA